MFQIMTKNTGKPSEKAFEAAYKKLGKMAYVHRFVDASEIKGKTGVVAVSASAQPSDYMLVEDGKTSFAEVKSTVNETSFPFSLLKKNQNAAALMIMAAGGEYLVFVHAVALDRWFKFNYQLVLDTKATDKASIKWTDLLPHEWNLTK